MLFFYMIAKAKYPYYAPMEMANIGVPGKMFGLLMRQNA